MNRENNILLNSFYPDVKSLDECFDFLSYSAYDSILTLPSGSRSSAIFCLLTYLCGYSTINEYQFMLGPCFKDFYNYVAHNVKKGLVDKYSLPLSDFGSYVGYHVTDAGFAAYLPGISDYLKEWGGVRQKRRTTARGTRGASKSPSSAGGSGQKVSAKKEVSLPLMPMHDYGLGLSILSLLSLRRTISISKEALIQSGAAVRSSGKLRMDAIVGIESNSPVSPKNVIYLEQDMGTESARQLINKLYVYGDSRILNPDRDCIILSCHAPSGPAGGDRFDSKAMGALLNDVLSSGESDVYSYYANQGKSLSITQRISLESLLICVGAADRRRRASSGLFERATGISFTVSEFASYVRGLSEGNNPYYERHVNAKLTLISKKTLRSVCEGLENLIFYKEEHASFLSSSLFQGYGIYVLPSTLLANSSHLYLRADSGSRLNRYINSIAGYYPNFVNEYGFASYGAYSSPGTDGEGGFEQTLRVDMPGGARNLRVTFANVFFSMTGDLLCIEHLGRDAGAFIRLLALARATNRAELNLHVIAVCDSVEDAHFFCRRVDPIPFIKSRDGGKGFRFTFLFEQTVLEDGNSPLFEFNKPYNSVAPYLELSYNSPVRPRRVNASNYEVFSYSISSFA